MCISCKGQQPGDQAGGPGGDQAPGQEVTKGTGHQWPLWFGMLWHMLALPWGMAFMRHMQWLSQNIGAWKNEINQSYDHFDISTNSYKAKSIHRGHPFAHLLNRPETLGTKCASNTAMQQVGKERMAV